ncbi:ATP-binding cassette domain-containing protein [Variovorax sp. dw_308]|uniref:ABC transporter ATP-binding protein n=1 Tax=Variovorax sp. dw_308 TaxID=2721546 RepID=UPI001C46EA62|nr:ATP-binding cassette domain-containing protein [Variovorax sp. dw_308]
MTATPDAILHLQDLGFAYPGQPPLATRWTASIAAGVTLLHGDTGSGKSTLLRILAGTQPATGRLSIANVRLDASPEAYCRKVFFIEPDTDAFDKQKTARECTASLRADDPHFDASRWQSLVDGFALAPHIDKPMYMLSTGSRRKTWLAAALASGRPLTLLDEPTGALDAASIRCLWRTLGELSREPRRAFVIASGERIAGVALAATIDLPLQAAGASIA